MLLKPAAPFLVLPPALQKKPADQATFSGAYDAIPDLVHLYEPARRGLSSYTGSLVRIREDGADAEMDFGYDENGELDIAAITTFLNGNNGFIVTIYDQVGSNNPTQATSGIQPAYVASGQNSKPIARCDGANDYLTVAFSSALSQPHTVYAAASLDAGSVDDDNHRYMTDGNDGSNRLILRQRGNVSPNTWNIFAGASLDGGVSDSSFNIWAALFNGASSQFWINATSEGSGDAGSNNADGISIGTDYTGNNAWDGDIGMIAIADPSHDDTERGAMQTAINSFWSAY